MHRPRPALVLAPLLLLAVSCATPRVGGENGMCRVRLLRSHPFAESRVGARDLEGLTLVIEDDTLWVGDDNANQIYVLDSRSGAFRARLRERDFTSAFPDASQCDDGDDNDATKCSYTAELEGITYDGNGYALYVVNTVNDTSKVPPVDKPALFRMHKPIPDQNFRFDYWKALPIGPKYGPAVVIDGALYLSLGRSEIVRYDPDQNDFAELGLDGKPVAAYASPHGTIVGLDWDGTHLWVLGQAGVLSQVDWSTRQEVASWDLAVFDIGRPKGLAIGRGEIYVVDGNYPRSIHVLSMPCPS